MTTIAAAPPRMSLWLRLRGQLRNLAPLVTLAALVVLFTTTSSSFATWANLGNVLQQVSITAIIAALRAGTPAGARALAREHVLHSFELLAHVLEQFGSGERRLRAERG